MALRDAINAGWVTGPRIFASTRALAPAGGQFGPLAQEAQSLIHQEYAVVSGVEEARRAVRQALYDGADCIKVIVEGGRGGANLELVRKGGLEPPRCCHRQPLKLVRLPIPPLSRG